MQYRSEIDLEQINDAHSLGILLVPPGSRVLDVGCATGEVARALVERGCEVSGIEIDEEAANYARGQGIEVTVGNVEEIDLDSLYEGRTFDAIMFLDVLEHLRDPAATLRRAKGLLGPEGRVVASIPNVTHGAVRLSILRGNFTYQELGLLDRTHIHFYDSTTVDELFGSAGMTVVERLRVTRGLDETEVDIDPATFPMEVLDEVLRDSEALTYQFIRSAVPASTVANSRNGRRAAPRTSLVERLQTRVTELEATVRASEAHIQGITQQLSTHEIHATELTDYARTLEKRVLEGEEILRGRMAELNDAHIDRRHLQLDLAVKDAYIAELRSESLRVAEETDARRRADSSVFQNQEDELARLRQEAERLQLPRYRVADRVNDALWRLPPVHGSVKATVRGMVRIRRWVKRPR